MSNHRAITLIQSKQQGRSGSRQIMTWGVTGSIAMGKSELVVMMKRKNCAIFDADRAVHRLLAPKGKAVAAVAARFPLARVLIDGNDAIDRKALAAIVFSNNDDNQGAKNTNIKSELHHLESIIHPLVFAARHQFTCQQYRNQPRRSHWRRLVVYDIPLLFETMIKPNSMPSSGTSSGRTLPIQTVTTVSAAKFLQSQRLKLRGMTKSRMDQIRALQLEDSLKRLAADFTIPSGLGKGYSCRKLTRLLLLQRSQF